jgi:2-aminoethylphosphonate dioxygenase
VLVTVDDSTLENGCLELSAGHHTRGLIGRKWKPLEGEELQGIEFKPYPMKPGDVAFFDCFVPHQSKPNPTRSARRNIYLTFNRAQDGDWREKYFADKRASYPPDNEREPGKVYTFKV